MKSHTCCIMGKNLNARFVATPPRLRTLERSSPRSWMADRHRVALQLFQLLRVRVHEPEVVLLVASALASILRTFSSQTAATCAQCDLLGLLAFVIQEQIQVIPPSLRQHPHFPISPTHTNTPSIISCRCESCRLALRLQ